MKKQAVKVKAGDKVDPSGDDFGTICVCAVRYSLGRMTYMPSLVQKFVMDHLRFMPETCLYVIARDVEEWGGPNHDIGKYGMSFDYEDWMKFLSVVKAELDRREKDETD